MSWLQRIIDDGPVHALAGEMERGGSIAVRGAVGSSTTLLAAALHRRTLRPVLLVVAHLDDADEAADALNAAGIAAAKFPALQVLPGETGASLELSADRLTLLSRLAQGQAPPVLVASIQALMQGVPHQSALQTMLHVLRPGDRIDSIELIRWLGESGYERVNTIDSAGEFAVRGDIIDVYAPGGEPARLDLFGDRIEHLFAIDLETMGSDRRLERVELVAAKIAEAGDDTALASLLEYLPATTVALLAEMIDLVEQGRSYFDRAADARGLFAPAAVLKTIAGHCAAVAEVNQYSAGAAVEREIELPVEPLPTFAEEAGDAVGELAALAGSHQTIVLCQNEGEKERLRELLEQFAPGAAIEATAQYLHRGLIWRTSDGPPLALIPYHELLHRYSARRAVARLSGAGSRTMDSFLELQEGDIVVHRDHGLGRFAGLQSLKAEDGAAQEFLTLEFAGRTTIHVPATQIDLVQKYVGALHGKPELSTIGGRQWKRQKERVAEAVRDLAGEMLRIQAAREAMPGIRYPADTPWQREFEAEFPYEETEDQLAAIVAMKKDMHEGRPMDRLVCGDVGFGKTEIAIRAAFKAAEYGKQVAVLVPTTVLAEQHERTFRERFADYPFRVESLSRFKTRGEQNGILAAVRGGQVDIVIGTHRLLSQDVHFADLGLVVIDEEQRFGVEHKHRLLEVRMTADVLTLSATPIPRTLHMAMLGLRDISSLSTAPLDRRAIVTEVIGFSAQRVRQAIQRELAREGQVYFVHNRVNDIQSVADDVRRLVPDARIVVGHGQMSSRELEKVMLTFMRRQADILVCTTIIESGIDIPTANTMFVNDAHRFGLSELHQLRGRVGRSKHRAYCYLLLPGDRVLSEIALKRLRAIESFSMLGAGFKIALRDLEIRGAGNLLGAEQSGHIAAVGYEMYCQLLEQAVSGLKHEKPVAAIDTTIDLGPAGPVALPKGYIPSDTRRMDAYRRVSRAASVDDLARIERDLESAYGDLPKAAETLLRLARLRILAATMGIKSITRHEDDIIIRTARPGELEQRMAGVKGTLRVVGQPDDAGLTSIYYRPPPAYLEPATLIAVLLKRFAGESADLDSPQRTQRTPTGESGQKSAIGDQR